MVKVELRDRSDRVETLWATPVGPDRYKLDNSPFYAYGVSWQDVIEARPAREGELPTLVRVVQKSGNRTLRVVLDPPADQSEESATILDWLVELGCSYEGAGPGFISINIPPEPCWTRDPTTPSRSGLPGAPTSTMWACAPTATGS